MKRLFILLLSTIFGTVTDIDGNVYETVQIGRQLWMAENLKVTHYNNGDEIPIGLDESTWTNTTEGAYAVYDDDPENAETYGNLYNWYVVDDGREVCPEGYHVPSNDGYTILNDYLGGAFIAGGKMKECTEGSCPESNYWDSPNSGATNESGFTALPTGIRYGESGYGYVNLGKEGLLWTSTTTGNCDNNVDCAWYRALNWNVQDLYSGDNNKKDGYAVRCLSDDIQSTTILVPDDFATIQEAIDYSMDGDTILVSAGIYYENINFNGKNISVIGDDRELTIIDGLGLASVVRVVNSETISLTNLTIQNGLSWNIENGSGSDHGGGILVKNNSIAYLTNLDIKDCLAAYGGGLGVDTGAQVYLFKSSIYDNEAMSLGGGAWVMENSILEINNSTITMNSSLNDIQIGGVAICKNANLSINNSIIQNNVPNDIGRWDAYGCYSSLNINYSNYEIVNGSLFTCNSSLSNNISLDPEFIDSESRDFSLEASSPCIDSGDPNSELDPDGTRADMGAYPFLEIPGCIDVLACNYNSEANTNNDSCDYFCHDNGDYSLSFDGVDDWVELPDIDLLENYTLTMSVKVNNHDNIGNFFNKFPSYAFLYGVGGNVYAHPKEGSECFVEGHPLDLNVTYEVSLTFDDGLMAIYLNGENVKSCNGMPNADNNNYSLAIGAAIRDLSYNEYFNGEIYSASIWAEALSQEQLQEYIVNGIVLNENLVSKYTFDSGSGDILYDHSGNQNHGTIYGAQWELNEQEISGCADELACNYNEEANSDDDSCDYSCYDNGDYSLSFDGEDDYVSLSNPIIFAQESFSISVDCYLNDFRGNDSEPYSYIVGTPLTGNTNDHGFKIQTSSDTFNGGVEVHINDASTQYFHVIRYDNLEDTNIELNKWYNLAMVVDRDNDQFSFYVDGNLVGSEIIDQNFGDVDLGVPISLGTMSENYTSMLNGSINNLNIWDKPLSQYEVQSNIENQLIGNEEGLIGLWSVDVGSGNILYDHSGNQNHGTIYGAEWIGNIEGCTDSLACNYDEEAIVDDASCDYSCHDNAEYSISFDNDRIVIPASPSINIGISDFSIEFWLQTTDSNSADIIAKSVGSGQSNPTDESWFYVRLKDQGYLEVEITDGYSQAGDYSLINSNSYVNNGELNFISIVFDRDGYGSIYINGGLDSYSSISSHSGDISNPYDLEIGVDTDLGNYYLDGTLDNVMIWGKVLSDEEIISHFNNTGLDDTENLLAYWKFNEGQGDIAYDHSGNQNHGTIYGAEWIENEVLGCTDPMANNYNSNASTDDDSCEGSSVNYDDFTYIGEFGEYYYYKSNNMSTWMDAFTISQNSGGYLSTIANQEENDFVNSFCNGYPLWIGFSDHENEGDWKWVTGEPVLFTNWLPNQPDNAWGGQHYGLMDCNSGQWDDDGEESVQNYILEIDPTILYGCTDELACNYNEEANSNDGSCDYSCHDNGDYSLSFDGDNDYVDFGDKLDMSSSFTVGAWAYNNGGDGLILSKHLFNIDTNPPWGKYTGYTLGNLNGEGLKFIINNDLAGHGENCPCGFSHKASSEPIYNEWFHVVGVFESGEYLKLYVNGQEVDNISLTDTSIDNTDAPFYIGALHSNYQDPVKQTWDGSIEDVFVIDRSLNNNEVENIYNDSNYLQQISGLNAYYNFNYGDGDVLYDHSGNQNHGTIYGAEWVGNEILGCTDEAACNYSEEAINDDGSCEYNSGTWYVSVDGNDGNCGSENNPLNSIQDAIDLAQNGDVVYVLGGSYILSETIAINKSLNLMCLDEGQCLITADQIGRGISITASDINVIGFDISGSDLTEIGILIGSNTDNIIIANNRIYGMALPHSDIDPFSYGILVFGQSTEDMPTNLTFSNNEIWDVTGGAIVLGQYTDSVSVIGNYIHDLNPVDFLGFPVSYGVGAELSSNLIVTNNTFENLYIASNILTSQASIESNIYDSGINFLLLSALSECEFDESIFWYKVQYTINYNDTDFVGDLYVDNFETAIEYADDGSTIIDSDSNEYLQNCFGEWTESSELDGTQGDINQDGGLNVLDIVEIIIYIFEDNDFDECEFNIADVSGDNNINVLDIIIIVSLIMGENSGCTDLEACNYDEDALFDDESCQYFDDCGQCGGNEIDEPFIDENNNGIWDNEEPTWEDYNIDFLDDNGNGVWDEGEWFNDVDESGTWDTAEPYDDLNGNGEYDNCD